MTETSSSLTVLIPCRNEGGNVQPLVERIFSSLESSQLTSLTVLFIDNNSTDSTQDELRKLCLQDHRIKAIFNQRDFGHVRSPFYGLLQSQGDAVIVMACDFQDPPELLPSFVDLWRSGFDVVLGQKVSSEETWSMASIRWVYYRIVAAIAEVELLKDVTGFGLYSRRVVEMFRQLDDPYPYVRGLVSELGFSVGRVPYRKMSRKKGISKNNFFTLYDVAMLAISSYSKLPLRIATIVGFSFSLLFGAVGIVYLIYKLFFWDRFAVGSAPTAIGLFFFASIQLLFIGLLGEYLGQIHTRVTKRPLVIEKERLNFQ